MISRSTIDKVKDIAIEDVAGSYTTLKRAGSVLSGCCPLHEEKTASFTVWPATGSFKCFGCGKSGDAIRLVEEKEGKVFIDAVLYLAAKYNIEVEYEDGKAPDPEKKNRQLEMLRVIGGAAAHYQKQLALPAHAASLQYLLYKRKLTLQTINTWRLGMAPAEGRLLTPRLIKNGLWQHALDVAVVGSTNGTNYDFFRNRIMVPIENRNGDIIALAGRKLPWDKTDGPKYMNIRNTDLYDKSKTLFGFSRAQKAIRELGFAVIVEGYFDVIKPHQFSFENFVATCGTALTNDHALLLKKHTKRIVLLRDGDKAGRKAVEKDIEVLSPHFADIKIVWLPEGMDPDSLFDRAEESIWWQTMWQFTEPADAYHWQCRAWLSGAAGDANRIASAFKLCSALLICVGDDIQQGIYVKLLCKEFGFKELQFKNAFQRKEKEQTEIRFPDEEMPRWVEVDKLYADGFVMNYNAKKDRVGVYFKADSKPVIRLTNYVVKPLYFIFDQYNPRRLVEVYNGIKSYVIELSNKALVSMDFYETEVTGRPGFYSEPGFTKLHFKRLVNWVNENTKLVYELKTLGWQPEGFFAFANKIVTPPAAEGEEMLTTSYDEYGIAAIKGENYLSPGLSKINSDYRTEDNMYENDMFLKYAESDPNFTEWAELFSLVYDDHAPFGIAFIFMSAFKDICSRVTKIPLAYFFGPKGSGKSAMAESMMWFFFSGKNAEGQLIQGYNLNPGQGTPFSFYSRLQRFRNVFMLFNEHDASRNEPWKAGAFKSSYDGEGREVGSGESGKKKKTEIQKVQCVAGIAGQYLDTTDDGAVMSRSVLLKFSLEKNKNRTDEQKQKWEELNTYERKGISSLSAELFRYRGYVAKDLKEEFWKIQSLLNIDLRKKSVIAEARILNNYSLCLALIKIMSKHVQLPFTYEQFYNMTVPRITEHARLLKDNNVLAGFWNVIEVLFTDGHIMAGVHFKVKYETVIKLKEGSDVINKNVGHCEVIYIRMNLLHDKFAKRFREVHNKVAPDVDSLVVYLKDQPYFIGLAPSQRFKDMNTSSYVLNYSMLKLMGVNLEKYDETIPGSNPEEPGSHAPTRLPGEPDDLPF